MSSLWDHLAAAYPEPKTALEFTTIYQLLVAVILSAQTTDVAVNQVTAPLFKSITGPEQMLALGEEGLARGIQRLGLYRNKAKHVIAMSQRLLSVYDGEVPSTREDLMTLPGVGRKTANVVLNVAFQKPTIAVDTHVFRVGKRLGLSTANTPDGVEHDLMQAVPKDHLMHAHHLLILHGRACCRARKPDCEHCVLTAYCPYYKEHHGSE